MSETLLPCVEIDPSVPAQRSIIWLHGLGADGNDFVPIVPELGLPEDLAVRFVFPHAPSIPITINNGFVMPGWYDIVSLDLRNRADEAGVRVSQERVHQLIRAENERGIPTENIILAGFSQGGAVAMHTAIRYPEKLAGLVALSTYLVCQDSVDAELSDANRELTIFQGHGSLDPMVPIDRGADARTNLEARGYTVEWHDYPMPHAVCAEEIAAVGAWLRARFAD